MADKKKYILIKLDENIGGGAEYQKNCLIQEAKKIGLDEYKITYE